MEPLPLAWPLSKCTVMSTARMKDIKKNTLKADLIIKSLRSEISITYVIRPKVTEV